MKKQKIFNYCEHCDDPLEEASPPTKEQYEMGLIQIRDGIVLLPKKIAKKNKKKGFGESHAIIISGYYCGVDCLEQRIKELVQY